jgi:glycosyltransferase involved in cell wall biosynthesis
VIDSFDLGGAQTFLLDLVRHLDSTRFTAEVAAMHGHGVFESEFKKAGIVTHSLSPGKFPPFYVPNFLRLLLHHNYDVLHFHLFGANLCAKPLAIALGHRAIFVHDQCNDASRDQNHFLLAADALANRGADRVIAVSESVRAYLIAKEGLDDTKVVMIPNGLDTEHFGKATEEDRAFARKELDLPEDAFVVGGVGRLVPQKNFKAFLEVAAVVLSANPKVLFMIAGSGPLENELKQLAAALGISERVCFLGHVSERSRLYHALDMLLMPSDFEGTPMALLEAMASGLPVVASAVDGIAEVCTDGQDALLLRPRDVAGYAAALNRLIESLSLREMLGLNARRRIVAKYEIRHIVKTIENLYEEVLAR